MNYIYIICPVRKIKKEEQSIIEAYVKKLEKDKNNKVFLPFRDVDETLPDVEIVRIEAEAIKNADEIHIYWQDESKGSHVDLGLAMADGKKKFVLINELKPSKEKSYINVILDLVEKSKRPTSIIRAQDLMKIKMNELPPKALEFARFLSKKYGFCGEVMLSAFAGYAQKVEGYREVNESYIVNESEWKEFERSYIPF
jgi:RNase H-fold protein (predicted Holliday junction resolvase)